MKQHRKKEIWKDILGYEGLYQISSFGRVKSYYKERPAFLKPGKGTAGYYHVVLYKDGIPRLNRIARLTAEAFIPNPLNNPCVNHKDLNKINNNISNLEWCTFRENIQHAWDNGAKKRREYEIRKCYRCNREFIAVKIYSQKYCTLSCAAKHRGMSPETRKAIAMAKYKKVIQRDRMGKKIKIWNSLNEAAVSLYCTNAEISNVIHGRRKTCRGYKWELLSNI